MQTFVLSIFLPGVALTELIVQAAPEILKVGCARPRPFAREFRLPRNADVAHLETSYEDGVLRIEVPWQAA